MVIGVDPGWIYNERDETVDSISHAEIRNILLKHGIRWRKSKMVLENSKDPDYDIKDIDQLRYNTPTESVLLYQETQKGQL